MGDGVATDLSGNLLTRCISCEYTKRRKLPVAGQG